MPFMPISREMPGPLKVLTLVSLTSVLAVVAPVFSGGVLVGQKKVGLEDWWTNGSGLVFAVAEKCAFRLHRLERTVSDSSQRNRVQPAYTALRAIEAPSEGIGKRHPVL